MSAQENTHEFKVKMTCGGCESSVRELLKKNQGKGIKEFNIDLGTNLVKIIGTISEADALSILEKSGKDVELVSSK